MNELPEKEFYFSFARSSGAGGQNVNKVNSKATLHWPLLHSQLPADIIQRLRAKYGHYITADDELQISSQESRQQKENVTRCLDRLRAMLRAVWVAPKKRKATRPTKASKERRLQSKRKTGEIKRLRRGGDW